MPIAVTGEDRVQKLLGTRLILHDTLCVRLQLRVTLYSSFPVEP